MKFSSGGSESEPAPPKHHQNQASSSSASTSTQAGAAATTAKEGPPDELVPAFSLTEASIIVAGVERVLFHRANTLRYDRILDPILEAQADDRYYFFSPAFPLYTYVQSSKYNIFLRKLILKIFEI